MAKKEKACIIVTQVRSGVSGTQKQKGCLKGLGLGKLNRARTLEDTPSVRGMVNKVQHLVSVKSA